jgi:hypothetical protein
MMKWITTLERLRSCSLVGMTLAIAACAVASTAPDDESSRALGVLQLESTAPVSASQPTSTAERWTPSVHNRRYLILPPQVVETPDTVHAGSSFPIMVRTIGVDGCWSADGGELEQSGDTIVIQPFDRHSGAAACTMVIARDGLEHPFSASFDAPGEGIIRVNGRRVHQGDSDFQLPVLVERRVVVVP